MWVSAVIGFTGVLLVLDGILYPHSPLLQVLCGAALLTGAIVWSRLCEVES